MNPIFVAIIKENHKISFLIEVLSVFSLIIDFNVILNLMLLIEAPCMTRFVSFL